MRSATQHCLLKSGKAITIYDFETEMSINSGNSICKIESSEDLRLPNLPIEWFTNLQVKRYNRMDWEEVEVLLICRSGFLEKGSVFLC